MGGSNSGWRGGKGRPQRKTRVDECRYVLTVKDLERYWSLGDSAVDGWLNCGIRYELRPDYVSTETGEPTAPNTPARENEPPRTVSLTLFYGSRQGDAPSVEIIERLTLKRQTMPFGPDRWHLTCPRCGRSARKLYIPPGLDRFACRRCHDLTYASVQTHDPRISRLRGDPARLAAILDSTQFIDAPTKPLALALQSIVAL